MVMPAHLESRWELSFGGHHSPSPNTIFGKRAKSPPSRQANSAVRTREHVSPDEGREAHRRCATSVGGRVAERDALLIMMAYRHGLRASEIAGLRWDQIDLKAGVLHVTRRKNGSPATHPLRGLELCALRSRRRQQFPNYDRRNRARWYLPIA